MSLYDLDYEIDHGERQRTLRECLPTWEEARMWSELRMNQGPMSQSEFDSFARDASITIAQEVNMCRCRTTLGWYIAMWGNWLKYLVEAVNDPQGYRELTSAREGNIQYGYYR